MSDPGLTIDQRGLRTSGGRLRTNLPDDLVARYEPLHNLNVSAGQADLVVARDRTSGEEVVVKLYRNAEQLDREVMERLYVADNAHVVRLIEHGETDGEPWEVQEYCSLGTLTDYRLEQGGHLSEVQALAAVEELADAIHHIHGLHITHRDLKPENILVRSLEPLDLVLTDFGVAAEQIATVQLQTVAASWAWAAPEVHTKGAVSRDIDWWAMGAIVHQLLTGRHPLSGSDGRLPGDLKVIRAGVVDGLYSTNAVVNERWRSLVDGLLSYEPTQRWGYEEVSAWLTGQNPEVVRTMPIAQQLRAAKNARPEETREHLFVWNGVAIRTGLELVRAMRAEWPAAAKFLDKWPDRPLRDWLLTRPDGQVMAQVMHREANGDGRLIRLQARFDPDGPLEFMGRAVSDESMNQAIKAAEPWSPDSGGEAGEAHTWLSAIRGRHIFKAIAAAVEGDTQRLVRADQLLNDWDDASLGFATSVRKRVQLDQSKRAADAAEARFKELLGFQFAAALSPEVPARYSDRSREMASRIRGTLESLGEHDLLPKSSPWAIRQRARDTILSIAAQVLDASTEDLGLHIPASIYLELMDQVCSHDLGEVRAEAERIRLEEVAQRKARERARREALAAAARAEAEAEERRKRQAQECERQEAVARRQELENERQQDSARSAKEALTTELEQLLALPLPESVRGRRARARLVESRTALEERILNVQAGIRGPMNPPRTRSKAWPAILARGERYLGTVKKITDYGAFVALPAGSDGLLRGGALGESLEAGQKILVEIRDMPYGKPIVLALAGRSESVVAVAWGMSRRAGHEVQPSLPDAWRRCLWGALAAVISIGVAYLVYTGIEERRDDPIPPASELPVLAWDPNGYAGWRLAESPQQDLPNELGKVVQLAGAEGQLLALRSDGIVLGWAGGEEAPESVPGGLSDVVQIATDGRQSLALKSDGTVVAWGPNADSVPQGLRNVKAIRPGIALMRDGTVEVWGSNPCNDQSDLEAPSDLRDVVQVEANGRDFLALTSDGTVVIWEYYCPNGTPEVSMEDPSDLPSGVTQVALGNGVAVALLRNGSVEAWGTSPVANNARLDLPDTFRNARQVGVASTGGSFTSDGTHFGSEEYIYAIGTDGTVVVDGDMNVPDGLSDVDQIAVADDVAVALRR